MVFSSHLFVFYFLPLVLAVYFALPRAARNGALAVASYLFYGWANPVFLPLMLASTVLDYGAGRVIARHGRSVVGRWAVAASVTGNLLMLGYFKYAGFVYSSLTEALGLPPIDGTLFAVTLPLGISFYTFQSMSYTLDLWRGRAEVQKNLVDFACYVSMFPQLVAGPILRYSELADQLVERGHSFAKASRGVAFFALGMAKKILLANPCGEIADACFRTVGLGPLEAWYGAFAYGFQIYFDFSGYSDMAIGLGLILGFAFPKNFDSPYRATSITDFWRRWHISLSAWLRDYLYIPLGGNRRGRLPTYRNLALVMLLGGLWHGAAWTFVAWGAFHGGLLATERLIRERGWAERWRRWLPAPLQVSPLKMAGTFLLVTLGWVLFRAEDIAAAGRYYRSMFGLSEASAAAGLLSGIVYVPALTVPFALAAVIVWRSPQTWDWSRVLTPLRAVAALGLFAASLAVLELQGHNPFIYFIF
ncbi:MAG: MBOAT family protein [Acidobacteriota bacterium]